MALTMLRVMQHKIKKALPADVDKDLNWSYGLPGNRLSRALLNWQVEQLSDEYYRIPRGQYGAFRCTPSEHCQACKTSS